MNKRQNFYTPQEVCELLRISRRTLSRWLKAGRIEAVELPSEDPRGNRYRFRHSELRRLGVEFNGNNHADKEN